MVTSFQDMLIAHHSNFTALDLLDWKERLRLCGFIQCETPGDFNPHVSLGFWHPLVGAQS